MTDPKPTGPHNDASAANAYKDLAAAVRDLPDRVHAASHAVEMLRNAIQAKDYATAMSAIEEARTSTLALKSAVNGTYRHLAELRPVGASTTAERKAERSAARTAIREAREKEAHERNAPGRALDKALDKYYPDRKARAEDRTAATEAKAMAKDRRKAAPKAEAEPSPEHPDEP